MTLLRHALVSAGHAVDFLSIQNDVQAFVDAVRFGDPDFVLVSSLDGHAHVYLRSFASAREALRFDQVTWYLGGHVPGGPALARKYHELGFRRVFTSFVSPRVVLDAIKADSKPGRRSWCAPSPSVRRAPTIVPDPDADWADCRTLVLEQWPTGAAASPMADNAAFLATRPNFAHVQQHAATRGLMLLQPRAGVATPAAQQELLISLLKPPGVGVLSHQVDSLTRNNDYEAVELVLRDEPGTLNGFPVVNHGVGPMREVASRVSAPLQVRHSTRDPRLLAEISFAGGATSFEGGAISYNIPYYRDLPLEVSVRRWRYVDRLVAAYYDRYGVVIDRELFGALTATLVPPCLQIAVNAIEAALALESGVQSLSVSYCEQGNRPQDIAAMRVLIETMDAVLVQSAAQRPSARFTPVFYQYMAAFPPDWTAASTLVRESATTARLAGAARVLTKTPAEALRIPTLADNLEGLHCAQRGADEAGRAVVDDAAVDLEAAVLREEVAAILSHVRASASRLDEQAVQAFTDGAIDIPFAPSRYNRGEVLAARDADGAVRVAMPGRLPLPAEVLDFHRDRLRDRAVLEGRAAMGWTEFVHTIVSADVSALSRGGRSSWPVDRAWMGNQASARTAQRAFSSS